MLIDQKKSKVQELKIYINLLLLRLATPEHDIDDPIHSCNDTNNASRALEEKINKNHNSSSASVPVTPKIITTDTKERPVSANTEGRNRNARSLLAERKTTSVDRLGRQGHMGSGESLYAYMDPYIRSYATPMSDIDMCEDIMELDDEREFDSNRKDALNTLPIHAPNSESKVTSMRRKSKNNLLQVLDPLLKLEERSRANYRRRKSDCNIILNGELVAVGFRRNSATIKICNNTLSENETVF